MPKRPVGRPLMLTPEVEEKICETIREGAFSWVAAVAAGISRATFNRWMAEDRPEYLEFRAKVDRARAQARVTAEHEVRRMRPEVWLRMGPGRDQPGEPGWTERVDLQHSGPDGGALQIIVQTLPKE